MDSQTTANLIEKSSSLSEQVSVANEVMKEIIANPPVPTWTSASEQSQADLEPLPVKDALDAALEQVYENQKLAAEGGPAVSKFEVKRIAQQQEFAPEVEQKQPVIDIHLNGNHIKNPG